MHTKLHNQKSLTSKRQTLRKESTPAEKLLWQHLRNAQLHNQKFKRQHSIGNFITDFYCAQERLVIEIDGDSHYAASAKAYDEKRTKFFESFGIRVIRFTNVEVLHSLEGVLFSISQHFKKS